MLMINADADDTRSFTSAIIASAILLSVIIARTFGQKYKYSPVCTHL